MTTIRNRGTAGDALNGTNTGLVKVEGPAVFTPVNAGNGLGIDAGTYPSLAGEIYLRLRGSLFDLGQNNSEYLSDRSGSSGVFTLRLDVSGNDKLNVLWWQNDGAAIQANMDVDVSQWGGNEMVVEVWRSQPSPGLWNVKIEVSTPDGTLLVSANQTVSSDDTFKPSAGSLRVGTGGAVPAQTIIQSFVFRSGDENGTILLEMKEEDIVDSADATVTITSGQTATVARSTTGPVTTLVPAGKTVLINPETGGSAVRIDWAAAGYQPLAGNDLVHGYLFNRGNVPGGQTNVFAGGGFNPYFGSGNPPSSFVVSVLGITQGAGSGLMQLTADPFEPCVVFVVLNHDTNILTGYCYDKTGEVGNTGGRAFTGEAAVNGGFFMRSVPGSFGCGFYREGAGIAAEYDDTTLAALASYLLTEDI
jgi:hypothetical protein